MILCSHFEHPSMDGVASMELHFTFNVTTGISCDLGSSATSGQSVCPALAHVFCRYQQVVTVWRPWSSK